jgi:hypothetical protein
MDYYAQLVTFGSFNLCRMASSDFGHPCVALANLIGKFDSLTLILAFSLVHFAEKWLQLHPKWNQFQQHKSR